MNDKIRELAELAVEYTYGDEGKILYGSGDRSLISIYEQKFVELIIQKSQDMGIDINDVKNLKCEDKKAREQLSEFINE